MSGVEIRNWQRTNYCEQSWVLSKKLSNRIRKGNIKKLRSHQRLGELSCIALTPRFGHERERDQ
jgi:hypothetical protein